MTNFPEAKSVSEDDALSYIGDRCSDLKSLSTYDNKEAFENLKNISNIYVRMQASKRAEIAEALIDKGYVELSVKIYESLNTLGLFTKDDIWFPAYYVLNIAWNYTDASKKFALHLAESNFLKILHKNITHKPYLDNQGNKNVLYVIKSSLSTIQNIARNSDTKHFFTEQNIADSVRPFLTSTNEFFKTLAVMTMTSILPESEAKSLEDTGAIAFMVSCIKQAIENTTKRRHRGFSPSELAESLAIMAVNDASKMKIVNEGALPLLVSMLKYKKDVEEQRAAAMTLWNLSFDDKVKNKIEAEEGCLDALKEISHMDDEFCRKAAKGALWIIEGKQETKDNASMEEGTGHIFLSYNHGHKDIVLRISNQLKSQGYNVWIDVDQMGGSTLEAMANGLEKAQVVVICMSEKYKLSPNCRTEAEYTFSLQKPIIPLMMQRYYKPDGWLGMLLGAKFYVNMDGKFPFDQAYQMFMKELSSHLGKNAQVLAQAPPDAVDDIDGTIHADKASAVGAAPSRPLQVAQRNAGDGAELTKGWSVERVAQWLEEKELQSLQEKLKEYNGELLYSLFKMKIEVPEFFYNTLKRDEGWKLVDILRLVEALESLYI